MVLGTALALRSPPPGCSASTACAAGCGSPRSGRSSSAARSASSRLVGHAARLDALYWQNDFTSMALHTAVCARPARRLHPDAGAERRASSRSCMRPTPGGRLLRRLIPAAAPRPGRVRRPDRLGHGGGLLRARRRRCSSSGSGRCSRCSRSSSGRRARSTSREARARAEAERFASVLRAATEHSIVGTDVDGHDHRLQRGRRAAARLHGGGGGRPRDAGPASTIPPSSRARRRARASSRASRCSPAPRSAGRGDARVDVRAQGRRTRARLAHRHRHAAGRRQPFGLHRHGASTSPRRRSSSAS